MKFDCTRRRGLLTSSGHFHDKWINGIVAVHHITKTVNSSLWIISYAKAHEGTAQPSFVPALDVGQWPSSRALWFTLEERATSTTEEEAESAVEPVRTPWNRQTAPDGDQTLGRPARLSPYLTIIIIITNIARLKEL
jgi:hypothetical protein